MIIYLIVFTTFFLTSLQFILYILIVLYISGKSVRGKFHQMLMNADTTWKFADVDNKGVKDAVSVCLPAYRSKYT